MGENDRHVVKNPDGGWDVKAPAPRHAVASRTAGQGDRWQGGRWWEPTTQDELDGPEVYASAAPSVGLSTSSSGSTITAAAPGATGAPNAHGADDGLLETARSGDLQGAFSPPGASL
jgi:hypothetical protein